MRESWLGCKYIRKVMRDEIIKNLKERIQTFVDLGVFLKDFIEGNDNLLSDEFEKLKFKQNFIKKIGHDTKLLDKSQTLEIEPLLSENIYASLYCEGQSQVNPILLKKAFIYNISLSL